MKNIRILYLIAAVFQAAAMGGALAQGSLEYRYGEAEGVPAGGGLEHRIREGWGQLWGQAGDGGSATGMIGSRLPPAEASKRRAALEVERTERLRDEIRKIQDAPVENPAEYRKRYLQEREIAGLKAYGVSRDADDLYVRGQAEDDGIRQQLGEVYYALRTARLKTEFEVDLQALGLEAVRDADTSFAEGDIESAESFYSFAHAAADILVGIDPISGTVRSVAEAMTGVNLITDKALSSYERGLAVFGVITLGAGSSFTRGATVLGRLASKSRLGAAAWEAALAYATHFEEGFRAFRTVGASSEHALETYGSVLREVADGPRLRFARLAEGTSDLKDSMLRTNPHLYKPGLAATEKLPARGSSTAMSRAEADAVGRAAVGPNFQTLRDPRDGRLVGYVSSGDGPVQYRYRPPAKKPSGTVQANIETFVQGQSVPLSNYHIDITDP